MADQFIRENPGVVFDIVKSSELDGAMRKQAEHLFKIETTETKRVLFLFHKIVSICERNLFKPSETRFLSFYKFFYADNDELNYAPGSAYKITGKDFYKVYLNKSAGLSGSPDERVLQ
jgi:hypothetical protein